MPKSKDLMNETKKRHAAALAAAMKSGDAAQLEAAMAAFCADAASAAAREAADDAYNRVQDATILSNRGQVVLTTAISIHPPRGGWDPCAATGQASRP